MRKGLEFGLRRRHYYMRDGALGAFAHWLSFCRAFSAGPSFLHLPRAALRAESVPSLTVGACRIYREAVTDLSPGLQPWVCSASESALKGRPTQIALNRRLAFMASQRHSWIIRVHSKRGATTSVDSAALSGRIRWLPDPGLKPWAKICNRFAVKSDRHLGYFDIAPSALSPERTIME